MSINPLNITEKIVLGTVQFGMDYGIANISGKPVKQEVFNILELAWEKGIKRFDTAPVYGSESLLGEFIRANGLDEECVILTKLPALDGIEDYESAIRSSIESSLAKLSCKIEALLFHDPKDSAMLLDDPPFFEKILHDYPVSTLGVSVYETQEVERLSNCEVELAFQFPFNVLDRRFEKAIIPSGRRYARSVFLQGLLASANGLRSDVPAELLKLKKEYHELLTSHDLTPVNFAVSFVMHSNYVDYFLVGVESKKQLMNILNREYDLSQDFTFLEPLIKNIPLKWMDPRNWS